MEGMDLLKPLRILNSMGYDSDKLKLLMDMAVQDPNAKYIVPKPGTDPLMNNGVDAVKLQEFLKGLGNGVNVNVAQATVALGGNPKSQHDVGIVREEIKANPLINYEGQKQARYLVQLAAPTTASAEAETYADAEAHADD